MAEKKENRSSVMINRAPVLTLWAAVVAEMRVSIAILSGDSLIGKNA